VFGAYAFSPPIYPQFIRPTVPRPVNIGDFAHFIRPNVRSKPSQIRPIRPKLDKLRPVAHEFLLMTAATFRRIALSLPEATESEHMAHPDFRVRNKIFATLWPGGQYGMVKLKLEQQQDFMRAEPEVFSPCSGAWGRHGATRVSLTPAKKETIQRALGAAWTNVAPKKLLSAPS
jgi:hypothetical protein